MTPIIVHVLFEGLPLCGFSRDVPSRWPMGHRWVSIMDRENGLTRGRGASPLIRLEAEDGVHPEMCAACEEQRDKVRPAARIAHGGAPR
jgi:hypothetical protein